MSKSLHTYLPGAQAQVGLSTELHKGGHGECKIVVSEQIRFLLPRLMVLTLAAEGGARGWGWADISNPGKNRKALSAFCNIDSCE